jgi:hypothetical protein
MINYLIAFWWMNRSRIDAFCRKDALRPGVFSSEFYGSGDNMLHGQLVILFEKF